MRVNVSIDDVSPHRMSSVAVLEQCEELRREFSEIVFTLFIPTAYWRTVPSPAEAVTSEPLRISQYPEFCRVLSGLSPHHYELCYHGHYHGIPGRSNNDELQGVSYGRAAEVMAEMLEEARLSGLPFRPVLRPPAWRMSAAAFDAAWDLGLRTLALSRAQYAVATHSGADLTSRWTGRIVRCDAAPPFLPLIVGETLEVVYHSCVWDQNYLSVLAADQLAGFLRGYNCQFCHIEEMV